jgi:hypothetical protein
MTVHKIVPLGLVVVGVYFLWSALKNAFIGGSVNAVHLAIGIACLLLGAVINQKQGTPPAGG